ncbi:MBOAT family O-acyltransferase [Bacteriovorax sp. PP10]|uniref:MBOAT family O-acyltransferase n=1 Tax=Bacteriovorax antarcticus TaxID=3088717 RepID=A0ABU5VUA1_9BACT|nr:MBOAT family O-acyltransferase [Bacteriovorax sp. PP10]MEA9356614.1 MBOAT family O-acyltransferase [Bacteriovorax sp. PP10]
MLFNSLAFAIFFPIVTTLYYILPHSYRWGMLLAASCFFYMWLVPKYILILLLTIVVDYVAGIKIEESTGKKKKWWLYFSIITTCLILFFFKYFNFFSINSAKTLTMLGWNYSPMLLNFLLPVGLSFHTFQSLSYVIEVYRGEQKAERHFGIYSLYVMFYPQLVAGPIERPQNLLWQFHKKHSFEYDNIVKGLRQIAWGLFKKAVIADRLSILVNNVYSNPGEQSGLALTIATVFFAFQIYCDFSGYSDMAIGSAKVMGFKLMTNFNTPYFSKTISEFWKRWHISLSTWFKDYVYIPMGGNRCSEPRIYTNLFITFLLSGLWHGANWTYIFWGGINGVYLVFALIKNKFVKQDLHRHKWFNVFVTFALICFSWIFFRANNIEDAFTVIKGLGSGYSSLFSNIRQHGFSLIAQDTFLGLKMGMSFYNFAFSLLLIALLVVLERFHQLYPFQKICDEKPAWIRWSAYYVIVIVIILSGVFGGNHFIYFQF